MTEKIRVGKKAQVSEDFMVIARCESLISGSGLADAMERVQAYIEAGADGIMIHSKANTPEEIISFCQAYRMLSRRIPLVVVPSTFPQITEQELSSIGINVVIYANHMLRSAYPAMLHTAETILKNGRALEAEPLCMPIREIVSLI